MAEAVLKEIASLREVLSKGIAETREEVAILRSSDEALLGKLSALEARLAALEASGVGGGGGAVNVAQASEIALINARAVFDEQEARSKRLREEKRLHCVQCDRDYYQSYNAQGECQFHSGSIETYGSKYRWTCCKVEFRSYSEAVYVDGCCRSSHMCEHHTDYRYSAYQKWVSEEVSTGACEGWDENVRKSFVNGFDTLVEVGRYCKAADDGTPGVPRLYITYGEGRGDKTMALFSVTKLAELGAASATGPLPDLFNVAPSADNANSHYAARWIVAGGLIKGIETVVQPMQDSIPSVHRVLFDAKTIAFESVSRSDAPELRIPMDLSAFASRLSPPSRAGPELIDPPPYKVKKGKCEGNSTLRLKSDGDIELNQSFGSDTFNQLVFMKVIVINPEEKLAAVTETRMEYQNHGGEWVDMDEVRVSQYDNFEATATNFNINAVQTLNLTVKGYISIRGQCGSDYFRRSLAHRSLPQPLRVRVTMEDIRGAETMLVGEQFNKPLELKTQADLEKDTKTKIPLFLSVDDLDELDRSYVAVYRENNRIKIACPNTYWTYDDSDIFGVKWWKARTLGVESLEILREDSSKRLVTAHLLYDIASETAYGLRVRIESKNDGAFAEGSVLLSALGPRPGSPVFTLPSVLIAGSDVEASCSNVNAAESDWLGWFTPGTLDRAVISSNYVRSSDLTEDGCLKASMTLSLPSNPGVYELRYFKANTSRGPTFISGPVVIA